MGAIDKITYRVTLGNFTWMTLDATDTLVSGGIDGSVRLWKVVKEDDTYTMRLLWRTTTGQLTVQDACIQDAKGLSLHNEQLLTQRGAVGKVMNMVSVKSELDALSNNQAVGSSSLIVSQSVELLEHPME
ncbi:hypothetical protein BGX31_002836 [Mortierella sp. GBA43]|nr:hypothetical protein BGX31_002836 [Mortierella sp. GBA43]